MYLPICVCVVSVSLCLKHESFPSVPIRFFVVFFLFVPGFRVRSERIGEIQLRFCLIFIIW